METVAKIQTGLRLTPRLLTKLKKNANKEGKTFNRYVEEVLERSVMSDTPKLNREDFIPDDDLLSLGKTIPAFTQEEIDRDPRLSCILSV